MVFKLTSDNSGVFRLADNAFVPNDPRNSDWQAFLTWAKTNTPTPADPPAPPDPATERQALYPGVWVMLEAMYLARHGNPVPLAAIDLKIAAAMKQFPPAS